ncbi:MAG: flagellar hook-associated protein FlgK [Planctomycetaceae bacterium]
MGLSGALSTASSSLNLFSLGIEVAGNNIANASTPGYINSELVIKSSQPYKLGNLVIGTGAYAAGIRQYVDQALAGRIYSANGDTSLSSARNDTYQQLQNALSALGDNDLASQINQFIGSIQAIVNQPESDSLRSVTVSAGQQFADSIRSLRGKVDDLIGSQNDKIITLVGQVNSLIDTVRSLNPQIAQMQSGGSDAGNLISQRDQALSDLSKLVPIRVSPRQDGSVDVYAGSDFLVQGGNFQHLETTNATINGVTGLQVQTDGSKTLLNTSGGQLSGLIEGRDQILTGFETQLDKFTAAAIYQFNQIHSSGQGTKGYSSVTGTYGVTDSNAALNAAGLAFAPQNGSFQISVKDLGTGLVTSSNIAINLNGTGSDTTLSSLQAALSAVGNVTASVTSDGKLQISTDSGHEITFGSDTSGVLASLGINTFFTGTDSSNIQVNDVLKNDPGYLATGQGGGASDNRNAVLLAGAFDQAVGSLNGLSVSQFYNQTASGLAQSAAGEAAVSSGLQGFADALTAQREQQSGVNLDEEVIKILQFQHNYQAAARIITTVEKLMDTLLQL